MFITETNPVLFFKKYILRVCQEANINSIEKCLQIEYLSKMLADYVDPEKKLNDSGDLIWLIDALKAETDSNHQTLEGYKKTADRILFYHSFFPEAFKKRLINIKFYAKAARMFYRLVSCHNVPVCGLLSEEYSLWNFILNTARVRYMF